MTVVVIALSILQRVGKNAPAAMCELKMTFGLIRFLDVIVLAVTALMLSVFITAVSMHGNEVGDSAL